FEKSSPPVISPIGGMMMSLTSEFTIPPKAAPMMTPIARSKALPLTANSLNSFHIEDPPELVRDDVNDFVRNNHDLANFFSAEVLLNFWQIQRRGFQFLFARIDGHAQFVAQLPIYLDDDIDLVFDQHRLIVLGPFLFGHITP